jgi:GntR family transcriptional regulator, transcriptional repressor for pyruvate dehydrogenase complex
MRDKSAAKTSLHTSAARHLVPVQRVSVKDTVVERLIGLINEQKLGLGDRLPTELEMSEAMGVGRSSVREAVSTLMGLGLLVRRSGDGTYIASDLSNLILRPLKFQLMLDPMHLTEGFEARRILEGEFAYLAAERADRDDLAEIDRTLARMREKCTDPGESSSRDFDFHMAIARGAKNGVLFGVLNNIADLVMRTHVTTADRRGIRPQTMAKHEAIAEAIRQREPEKARALMIEHIEAASRHALSRVAKLDPKSSS